MAIFRSIQEYVAQSINQSLARSPISRYQHIETAPLEMRRGNVKDRPPEPITADKEVQDNVDHNARYRVAGSQE